MDNEKHIREIAKQEYANITCLEEIKWKQKTKVQWLKEGDNNTTFFHRIASARRNTNYIHSLKDVNGLKVDTSGLKDYNAAYFMNLYREPGFRRPKLDGVQFKKIFDFMRIWVEQPFEEDEVRKVYGALKMTRHRVQMASLWLSLNVGGMW